jgi:hypothetical protein
VSHPWRQFFFQCVHLHRHLGSETWQEKIFEVVGRVGCQLGLLLGSVKYRTTPVPYPWPWAY